MSKIYLENVSVTYTDENEKFEALKDINLAINAGEIISIIGPSGSGKSTLLNLLIGLKSPTGGKILVDGKELNSTSKKIGVVFQHYSLFPWLTVKKNITFGLKQISIPKKDRDIIADEYIQKVGLEDFKNKFPSQLSGGMNQRAAIARAFAMNTEILLLDEPFSALDSKNRTDLQELLLKLWDIGENKKTVVLVTHDIDEAIYLSDRIVFLDSKPGRIKEIINNPFNRPRVKETLVNDKRYNNIKNKLKNLFYEDSYEEDSLEKLG